VRSGENRGIGAFIFYFRMGNSSDMRMIFLKQDRKERVAKSAARMRKAKRTGAFIETTHLDCFQRAERGGCERCGPRACQQFTVVHTADEATDPGVMAFCSICGECVYFFIFFVWRDVYGQLEHVYMTPCFVLFVHRLRLQVAPAHGSVAAGDGRG